jgi:HEAT repeat protein
LLTRAAIHYLEVLGDKRAVPALIAIVNDQRFQRDAIKALKKITGQDFGDDIEQ